MCYRCRFLMYPHRHDVVPPEYKWWNARRFDDRAAIGEQRVRARGADGYMCSLASGCGKQADPLCAVCRRGESRAHGMERHPLPRRRAQNRKPHPGPEPLMMLRISEFFPHQPTKDD